jgi:hypothetical protein
MKNGTIHLENTWNFLKILAWLSYDPTVLLPGIYPRILKTYVNENFCMNVHEGIIHSRQNVETTQMSTN